MRKLLYRLFLGFLLLPSDLKAEGGDIGVAVLLAGIVDVIASATFIWWGLYFRKDQLKTIAAIVAGVVLIAAVTVGGTLTPKIFLYAVMGNALVGMHFLPWSCIWCGIWLGIAILAYSRFTGITRACVAVIGFTAMVIIGEIILYKLSPYDIRKILEHI